MTCRLAAEAATENSVDRREYERLHPDGQHLITDWFARAERADDSFEGFIYLWIAFNAWAACVTGHDRDYEWLHALRVDRDLCTDFDALARDPDSRLGRAARDLRDLMPIFQVQELRQLEGVDHWADCGSRDERAAAFRRAGARKFEPLCWFDHDRNRERPFDWPHTVVTLYRIRCNLFHGEKTRTSDNDQLVVRTAHRTLLAFLRDAGYM